MTHQRSDTEDGTWMELAN